MYYINRFDEGITINNFSDRYYIIVGVTSYILYLLDYGNNGTSLFKLNH